MASSGSREPSPQGEPTDSGVFFVSLTYKGVSYDVPVQAEDPLASIFDFIQEALDFPRENCKLIHRGKMLRPDHGEMTVGEAGLMAAAKVMLVASSAHDVSFVQSSRADPLVKGFVEEERDEQSRRKRARAAALSAWGTKQDAEYRFNSIKAEFKYSEPPPYEAERLLQRLSTDPGIIEIMKNHNFKVGILTEMSPVEAQERMAKRGTPNMDLLGYNQNAGEMIVLRLRTDNLKGFRPYHDLINTLIHELTHNVWGPHDHNFWKLFGELKAEYMRFHRFWSHGGRASDSNATGQFEGFVGEDGEGASASGFGWALGGSSTEGLTEAERRQRVLAAVQARTAAGIPATTFGFPNFLSGDGKWVFACPCGQIHAVEDVICPIAWGTDKASESGPHEPTATASASDAAPESPAPCSAADAIQVEESPLPEGVEVEEHLPAAPGTEEAPKGDAVQDRGATADSKGAAPPSPQPMDVESVAAEVPLSGGTPSSSSSHPGVVPDLDLSELEAQGLDGAALWLRNFSSLLRALCRPDRPGSRTAVELMLRLVQNVVDRPDDPKFRRIRTDNPKIRTGLLGAGADVEALMRLLGFELSTEPSGECVFVLRDAAFDTARLRMGKELLEMELSSSVPAVR